MNILEISSLQELTPPEGYGGTERFVHWLSDAFVEAGNYVSVVCKLGSSGGKYKTVCPEKGKLTETIGDFLVKNKVDIIHMNIKDRVLLDYLKPTEYKVVITLHNNFRHSSSWVDIIKENNPNFYFTTISNGLKKRVLEALEFNAVILPNNEITNLGFGMPLGCELTSESKQYYLYLGVIARYKGVLDIVKAFANTGKQLLIVGPCNDPNEVDYYNEILDYTKRCPNIKYFGATNSTLEKAEILSKTKALLVATGYDPQESDCYEAFGLVMLEANNFGVPVIGYAKGNINDYIVDDVNGYKFQDINQLPKLLDKVENGSFSKTCVATAKNYDIRKVATQYLKFFNNILRR